ncbi:MAG: Rne/Rng family ribonuclease [Paracoccaceae bacterium]
MSKKMLIDATHAEETRVVVVDGNKVEDFDFESENKRQLAGNIYLAKVTRVEPSLQAAFVEYGGNRHGFLAFAEVHPDYYQIPQADRKALMEEEARAAREAEVEEEEKHKPRSRSRRRGGKKLNEAQLDEAQQDDAAKASASAEDEAESTQPLEDGAPAQADETVSEPATVDDNGLVDGANEDGDDHPQLVETPEGRNRRRRPSNNRTESVDQGDNEYETVGAEDVAEEVAPRRAPRHRRYKIQEVIKVRQIMLIQVVKEERGNKGAAVTTYLSLAGRYCVLMPNTARGGGISRKITNISDRKKLKEIASEIQVPAGAGLIIRTAGSQRTKAEIKRDYEYLLRQWEQIRDLTLKSMAPAPIYEEGSLIKRSIRDLYNREIDEIWVDGEAGYREAKDYMKMLMPSHAKNVKRYDEPLPLFARYQVENYLSAMFNPTVQLKSGGYIVIGITEALVAIDVNSGRSTREGSIEDTALKTNLEAAEEVAHQLKLRDLAGLIVIDFIDMEDRRNNLAVEKKMKDKLKNDRARIQVGRISGFGLMEMSRQRLRPGMIEATTQPCPHCHGTGITRSNDSMALAILRELEEEGVRKRAREVLVTAPVEVANYLLNAKREHVMTVETRFGLSVRIESDPTLISPEYRVERFKTTTRPVVEVETVSFSSVTATEIEDDRSEDEAKAAPAPAPTPALIPAPTPEAESDDDAPRKKRRRRRRRGGKGRDETENGNQSDANTSADYEGDAASEAPQEAVAAAATPEDAPVAQATTAPAPEGTAAPETKAKKPRTRKPRATKKPAEAVVEETTAVVVDAPAKAAPPEAAPEPADEAPKPAKPARKRVKAAAITDEAIADPAPQATPKAEPAPKAEPVDDANAEPEAPRKRGWWSRAVGK